jgi:hypothetical protein
METKKETTLIFPKSGSNLYLSCEAVMSDSIAEHLVADDAPIPPFEEAQARLILSLTGDVLSFERCPRQYGFQKIRGYSAARATQEFIGTFAHRCLERAVTFHRNHRVPPDNAEMARLMGDVKDLLKDQRRRPHSWKIVEQIGLRLMRLNRTFADRGVYERVLDTERALQSGMPDFVLEGRVDVIQHGDDAIELWDYKAMRDPRRTLLSSNDLERRAATKNLRNYELQLRLYAHLHEQAYGVRPTDCRLLFLNEIQLPKKDLDTSWHDYEPDALAESEWNDAVEQRRGDDPGLFFSIDLNEGAVEEAVNSFCKVGQKILEYRESDHWPAPEVENLPDKGTCDACDFRWSCPSACQAHGYDKRL